MECHDLSLKIENVSKYFGNNPAINNLNLEIPENQIYGFLGANGASKTTMFRIILGLLSPSKGYINWNGKIIDYSNSDEGGVLMYGKSNSLKDIKRALKIHKN